MIGEVQANLSFSDLKLGQKIRVDIRDPVVAALVQAGYLTILWREYGDLDGSGNPGGGPDGDLDPGMAGVQKEPQEGPLDGDGADQPGAQSSAGT